MSGDRRIYTGRNGRRIAIDLARVEAIMDEGDGQVDLFTSSDHFRVLADFDEVAAAWQGEERP